MADVEQNVVTRFVGEDNVSGTLMSIAQNAIGVGAALYAAQTAAAVAMGPINTAMGWMNKIIQVQSQAANTQLELTSTFRAYEVFGQTSAQIATAVEHGANSAQLTSQAFETAGVAASHIMAKITRDAATLPGTAQQYLMVFQQALPAALGSTQRSVTEIADLTNHAAAVAISNGIDAAQAGRDMMSMFQGHADMMNRTYQVLGPLMTRSATDHTRVTQQQLNAMRGDQRFDVIKRAVDQYGPMLGHMGETWDAMVGTYESSISTMIQQSTGEIFHKVVSVFGEINQVIDRYSDAVVRVGVVMSHWAVEGFNQVRTQATAAFDHIQRMGTQLMAQPWFNKLLNLGTGVVQGVAERALGDSSSARSRIGLATAGVAGIGALAGGGSGVVGALAFGSFLKFLTNTEAVGRVMTTVHNTFAALVPFVVRVSDTFDAITDVGGRFFADFLPAVGSAVEYIVKALVEVGGALISIITPIGQFITPILIWFGNELRVLMGHLAASSTAVHILSAVLGAMALMFVVATAEIWVPIAAMIAAITAVVAGLTWLANRLGWATDDGAPPDGALGAGGTPAEQANPPWLQAILDAVHHVAPNVAAANDVQNPSNNRNTPRNRGGTHNDFRFSRFDITQKFSEGFDQDRLAAVFVSDLEQMANHRLDSSFSPAFSLS